jgi:uncharacterized membrane protein YbhN (UPF0104 family)
VSDQVAEDAASAAPDSTIIIEDGVYPRTLRRPLDLARFLLAVLVTCGIVLIAWFATSTAAGLDTDITSGASQLPSPVLLIFNVVGGIGTLGLPIAAAIMLILRKRVRQVIDSFVAMLVAVIGLTLLSTAVVAVHLPRLLAALAGSTSSTSVATPPILAALIAFVTVSRLLSRQPWNVLAIVVVGSVIIVTVVNSGIALAGIGISITLGWGIGLLTRYIAGTPTSRPSGLQIAQTMDRGGFPLLRLQAMSSLTRGRRYLGTTRAGGLVVITVLDRDLEGAGLVNAIWTSLRLRDDSSRGAFNMRRALDHTALMAYAAQSAGAPVPRLLVASEIGPDSCLLAWEHVVGSRFSDLPDVSDDDLAQAWRAMRTLHEHQISHRGLIASHLMRGEDGRVWLIGGDYGTVAAGDVAMRIDVAELLCTLAMQTSPERAIATGRTVLGVSGLVRALPALQPVALSGRTRAALRKHKGLIVQLRDALVEMKPSAATESIQFERIKPRTLVMIVVGTIAGYLLVTQLAQVNLVQLVTTANWGWVAAAVGFSLITFFGAAWSLNGFVPERLKLHRTLAAQLAGNFATLVSPPTIGSIAINVRYLQKSGLHPALAAASVGVSQVMAFIFHIVLLFVFGIAAGTTAEHTFNPPRWVVIAVVIVVILMLASLAVPYVRKQISQRVVPLLREVGPRLATVAQRPAKLAEGIGGILLLNLAFVGVLYASIEAFGGSMAIAVVAVVYLAGATLGQAAPTPGGLGAVEAALVAGLTAGGLNAGIAVSAVLLYRLITFWIPTIPGYWAFTWLSKIGAL